MLLQFTDIISESENISLQARVKFSKNALLADVCISTSAAPTILPAHYFETTYEDGTTRSFNLIDGGVAANNPVYFPT